MDEPALREGLPLKQERWNSYLKWAVDSFRLATAVAKPETQLVSHLCYSSFEVSRLQHCRDTACELGNAGWWLVGTMSRTSASCCSHMDDLRGSAVPASCLSLC